MKDKIFMILLGIIAVNLTIQTLKDVEIFPTANAQSRPQRLTICNPSGIICVDTRSVGGGLDGLITVPDR